MPDRVPMFLPGEVLTAAKLNELVQLVEKAVNVRMPNTITVGNGVAAAVQEEPYFWAKITGSEDVGDTWAHSFVEVVEDPKTGTFNEKGSGLTGRRSRTPLYDINDQQIKTGRIVKAWVGLGEYYLCDAPGGAVTEEAAGSSGSGSGGTPPGTVQVEVVTNVCPVWDFTSSGSGSGSGSGGAGDYNWWDGGIW